MDALSRELLKQKSIIILPKHKQGTAEKLVHQSHRDFLYYLGYIHMAVQQWPGAATVKKPV